MVLTAVGQRVILVSPLTLGNAMNLEVIGDVVDHALHIQKKHKFSISDGNVRDSITSSMEILDIELSHAEIQKACNDLIAAQ